MRQKAAEEDPELITKCLLGDLAAWSGFTGKYSRLVYISIENRLHKIRQSLSREDIEDIRQNIFTDIWKGRKLADLKNARSLPYWLAMVSGNAAMEYLRQKARREGKECLSFDNEEQKDNLIDFLQSNIPHPGERLDIKEVASQIDELVDHLPLKQKLVLKLNLYYDKNYSEISGILGLPSGTVSSYIKRGKERLKAELKKFLK